MPKFGFTQEDAQIVRWLVQPGEAVEQGDPIAEVTTDKVNMEVEAPASGILDGLRFREGDTVPVTEIIAYIRAPNEVLTESAGSAHAMKARAAGQPVADDRRLTSPSATPIAAKVAHELGVDVSGVPGTGPGGRITRRDVEAYAAGEAKTLPTRPRAVPAARRLARDLGVELAAVTGSGPRGRIQSEDVRAFERQRTAPRAAASRPAEMPSSAAGQRSIPLTNMRRTIAQRLQKSYQEAPHITFDAEIDVTETEALRARANARLRDDQPRISLTAIIVKAAAWALGRHPLLNARLEGDHLLLLEAIHIGVGVALDDGLIVPVVRDVPRKGLAQIAAELADLVDRARSNRLRPDDVAEGTFTISNLGMYGVDRFTAIINPPQTAILAVSRARKRIVPDERDQPVVRPLMMVTLSVDHRVVDGAVAARFMHDLREGLEHPALLTL